MDVLRTPQSSGSKGAESEVEQADLDLGVQHSWANFDDVSLQPWDGGQPLGSDNELDLSCFFLENGRFEPDSSNDTVMTTTVHTEERTGSSHGGMSAHTSPITRTPLGNLGLHVDFPRKDSITSGGESLSTAADADTFPQALPTPSPRLDQLYNGSDMRDMDIEDILSGGGMLCMPSTSAAENAATGYPRLSSETTFAPNDCRCLQRSVCFADELGSKCAHRERLSVNALLVHLREGLKVGAELRGCNRCTQNQGINMVLAMATGYLSQLCERVVSCYLSLWRQMQHGRTSAAVSRGLRAHLQTVDPSMNPWFSAYQLDGCEFLDVLGALVVAKLAELERFIDALKCRARNRDGQLAALLETERRVQGVRGKLNERAA